MNKLTLLSGQVKKLKVRQMTKSAFASNSPQKLAEVGALTAAALGSVYASTVMASSRLKMTQEVEVFSCEVNGVKLVGCFGEVTFMNNHNLEFVVEYINDEKTEAIAHAARNTQKKVIWVSPYQSEGELANRKGTNKLIFWGCILAFAFTFFVMFFSFILSDDVSIYSVLKVGVIVIIGCPVIGLIFKLIGRMEIKDAKNATEVFKVFGYGKPSEVDLHDNCFEVRFSEKEKTGVLANMPQWVYRYRDSDLVGD